MPSEQKITFNLPGEELAEIEKACDHLRKSTGFPNLTRSDCLRSMLRTAANTINVAHEKGK